MGGIVQGMTFGVGSAMANRAVDAVMGPRTMNVEHTNAPAAPMAAPASSSNAMQCQEQYNEFQQCMKFNNNNQASCQFYFDMLDQCKRSSQ